MGNRNKVIKFVVDKAALVCGLQLLMSSKQSKLCSFSVLSQQWDIGCSWYQNVAHLSVNLLQKFES